MSDKAVKDMNFEDAMAELEAVVVRLENQQVALEDSIKLYERGAELRAHCEKKLRTAEEKVAQITRDAEGEVTGATPVETG